MARPSDFRTIYLDSSAFIAAIKNETGCEPIRRVLELADTEEVQVYASPLILVEARGQGRGPQDSETEKRALAILSGARILDVEFTRSVALRARRYVGAHGLKPPDAIHLASAVAAEVDLMWTLDHDFSRLWKTRVENVWVDQPYEFGAPRLPGM